MLSAEAKALVDLYQLQPLEPEGGYFARSFCSELQVLQSALPKRFRGDRPVSTAIYYLLAKGMKSRLHRIASDELWHFYKGGPLTVAVIHPDGKVEEAVLGPDLLGGHRAQLAVRAGRWFGAFPNPGTEYSFVGCTVGPGFDFAEFELGERGALLKQFPHATQLIESLT